jgi:hypothetical protein
VIEVRRGWSLGLRIACWMLGASSARAYAGEPAPVAAEVSKLACLQRHEDAQLARKQGQLLAARSALLACSRAACPDAVRADCVDWLEEVNRSIPSVVVTARDRGADVADVKVFMDGELVAARLTGGALEADPGEHHFRFELARGPVVERTVLLGEGARNRPIDLEFAPPPVAAMQAAPPLLPPSSPPPWSFANHPLKRSDYLFGGVALAGLATAAVLGIWASHERSELEGSCGPFCTAAEVSPLRTKLVIADVALGTAVAALAVGAYRYFTRAPTTSPTDVKVIVGASGGTLLVGRTF